MNREGRIIVVMGVSGCGKSTIAEHLAQHLEADFLDADSLHPPSNIEKMSRGDPLDDSDRAPWLEIVSNDMSRRARKHGICVTACSSLKRRYRDVLRKAGTLAFVHLDGDRELIATRMQARDGHFMPDSLLDSQFAALEHPGGEPDVFVIDITPEVRHIAENAAQALTPFLSSQDLTE